MENKRIKKIEHKSTVLSLRLYASFYSKFFYLETTLKERLFNLIKNKLGQNWFNEELISGRNPIFREEKSYILHRKPNNFVLSDYGLKAESGLGFWVEFFSKTLYKETKGVPIKIFNKLPNDIKRKQIYQKLKEVKELRNDLFHYRISPIINRSQLKNIKRLEKINENLILLSEWLDLPAETNDKELNPLKAIDLLREIWE